MKNDLRRIITVALAVVFALSTVAFAEPVDQPFMQAALNNLRDAQNSLRKASADKGGHRERAMDLTANAIAAVNNGIAYDRTHLGNRPRRNSTDAEFETNLPDQPNMVKARQHLQDALSNLNKASADKGGHRERAMGFVRDAISQVNAGIEYDRTH